MCPKPIVYTYHEGDVKRTLEICLDEYPAGAVNMDTLCVGCECVYNELHLADVLVSYVCNL
jgi:hypothetical protein